MKPSGPLSTKEFCPRNQAEKPAAGGTESRMDSASALGIRLIYDKSGFRSKSLRVFRLGFILTAEQQ